MSGSLPLPAALPPAAAAAATPPASGIVTVVTTGTASAASAIDPVALLSTVTDAQSLFGALMTIANATPTELKNALAARLDDAPDTDGLATDAPVATDPLAAALLALPVIAAQIENRDAHPFPLNGDAPLSITADGRPAPQAPDPRSVPDSAKLVCVPVCEPQILPTLPATPADPAPHHVPVTDATPRADAPAPLTALQIPLPATAAANAPPPQAPEITVPPSHPQWAEQVAASVVWCVKQKLTEAEVRLHPPELGPLRVTLRLDHDSVDVRFVAANPATRDALEQTLPQLRELFQQQGLSLVQAQVGDSSAHASRERMPQLPPVAPIGQDSAGDAPVHAATLQLKRAGLLDEYA